MENKPAREPQIGSPARLGADIAQFLSEQPGKTASLKTLKNKFGATEAALRKLDTIEIFIVRPKDDWIALPDRTWVRLAEANPRTAQAAALAATRIPDQWWEPVIELSGTMTRPDSRPGKTARSQVFARTYTPAEAATLLQLDRGQVAALMNRKAIDSLSDPTGQLRIPVEAVQTLLTDAQAYNALVPFEFVTLAELAAYFHESVKDIGSRLGSGARREEARIAWGHATRKLWPGGNAPRLPDFRAATAEIERERTAERARLLEETREHEHRSRKEAVQREREERQRLRAQLLEAFPAWKNQRREFQKVIVHVGPPNSGKTYQALEALKAAGSGWYLAPLRLLAFEIYDRLNAAGTPCNLLTGEESLQREWATITAATVEMFDARRPAQCVILDEAQMLADADRGWAWTRALMEAEVPEIHVITSPTARKLIENLAKAVDLPLEVVQHERLTPIMVADQPWPLDEMPARTILVAFSRRNVLTLKTYLEKKNRTVSVVYGALPPEVRRKQADRFADRQTEICIATDAVGMGLNLPADNVCFYEVEKFDGRTMRTLTPSEVHQIGGRAGRYGLATSGVIGAADPFSLKIVREQFAIPPKPLTAARIAPELEDLELLPGSLAQRLSKWRELSSVPEHLRGLIEPTDIEERVALAEMLKDREVAQIGLAAALRMVNAPTKESTRMYWRACAERIINNSPMPLPMPAPDQIIHSGDLDMTEHSISCADIYLWLSQREEFSDWGPEEDQVREARLGWTLNIDAALSRQLDTRARCSVCGRPLPVGHRFSICDRCYRRRTEWR